MGMDFGDIAKTPYLCEIMRDFLWDDSGIIMLTPKTTTPIWNGMAKTSIADASTISTRYLHRFDKTENGKSEMRKAPIMLGILSLAFLQTLANANAREQLSADALRAFAQGANIEMDLRVVDSTGKPVEGASVNVGLSRKQSDDFKSYAGRTDTNGNWRAFSPFPKTCKAS